MENSIVTGLSIRKELLQRIEAERGDISRSRFMSRLMEQGLEKKKMMDLVTSQQSTTVAAVVSLPKEDDNV